MKKSINKFFLFFGYIAINYIISIYLYQDIQSSEVFYIFADINSPMDSTYILISLWLFPKLAVISFYSKNLIGIYKSSYVFFFVRTRNTHIWCKKVIGREVKSMFTLCSMKMIVFFTMLFPTTNLLNVIEVAIFEFVCLEIIILAIFMFYLLMQDDRIVPIGMIVLLGITLSLFNYGGYALKQSLFHMQLKPIFLMLSLLLIACTYCIIVKILKVTQVY